MSTSLDPDKNVAWSLRDHATNSGETLSYGEMKHKSMLNPPLPRAPVLGWHSFSLAHESAGIRGIDDMDHSVITTSGRAAIYHALLQLRLAPGSVVLVPTYHCPTMIAPVILANLEAAFFGIGPDGLPNLNTIEARTVARTKAIIVAQYFGRASSLTEVRQWCDRHGIMLIEDCAHCYFGEAGDRPVGSWGDFATASLSKFFPVPEGGVLASARASIAPLRLVPQGFKGQLKAWLDAVEFALDHGRFAGIHWALASLLRIKAAVAQAKTYVNAVEATSAPSMMQACDMGRISQTPAWATTALKTILPRHQIIARRRRNFALYAFHFQGVQGAHLLLPWPKDAVPYVFPLWVDEPDRVYHELRIQKLPVFRWDRVWPGTPQLPDDEGLSWSHHVLQLLCHQDLSEADITRTALTTLRLLSNSEDWTAALGEGEQQLTETTLHDDNLSSACLEEPASIRPVEQAGPIGRMGSA